MDASKNSRATFHSDPIWNDGILGFFKEGHPNKKNKTQGQDE